MTTIYTFRGRNYLVYGDVEDLIINEARESFDEYLDDNFEEINICGLLYRPSVALKRVDEIAYNETFCDYVSMFEEEVKEREVDAEELYEIKWG